MFPYFNSGKKMTRKTVVCIVFLISIMIISTSVLGQYVHSKPIMKNIQIKENETVNNEDSYLKEFNNLVLRVKKYVKDIDITNLKSSFTETKIEKDLNDRSIWDRFSIRVSIKKFEQKTLFIKELLENNADRDLIITEFHDFIDSIDEVLDKKNICKESIFTFLNRIIGLLMILVSLLMIFLFPLGMGIAAVLGFIDGIINGDITYAIGSALYAIYMYFPFAGALYVVGYFMFIYGYIPYIPP